MYRRGPGSREESLLLDEATMPGRPRVPLPEVAGGEEEIRERVRPFVVQGCSR